DDLVDLLYVLDHAFARLAARYADLQPEAQSRERRAQIVRNPGEQHGAVLLVLAQVRQHLIEAAVQVDDLGWTRLGQRGRRAALADACHGVVQLAQRTRQVARKRVGADEQHGEDDQAKLERAAGHVLARSGRHLKARPVRAIARDQLDPQQLLPRLDAKLGI